MTMGPARWATLGVVVAVVLRSIEAAGPPLVAVSPSGHFTCPGVCDVALPEAPTSSVRELLTFLMKGELADVTFEPLRTKLTSEKQEPLELVMVVVAQTTDQSASSLLSTYATPVLQGVQGSSFLGTFSNGEGPERVTAVTIQADCPNSAILGSDDLQALAGGKDPRLTNAIPDMIIATAVNTSVNYASVVEGLEQATGRKTALVVLAEQAVVSDTNTTSGTNTTEENVPLAGGMQPPEINSAGVMGLLTAALLLTIFIPGFLCLWRIEPPQTFEVADRDASKKKLM